LTNLVDPWRNNDVRFGSQGDICAAKRHVRFAQRPVIITDIRRLPKRAAKELEQFFLATDALEDKKLEFLGWHGPSKAIKAIDKCSL
jgi:inorganic pyrophosphatase